MAAIDVPHAARSIAATLERAGFETWCVGGGVRDALLGHTGLDWDFATAARPEQVRRIFRRTVPVGVEFGTVGVLDDDGVMHEVTTFREDVRSDGRHAVVRFGASLDEDLARRDFTINAIAYSPTRDALHDPFDGRGDLARGIVRAVGDPFARFGEDRLRALRALRFAARYGFEIDHETWRAVLEVGPQLSHLSAERVKQEMEKTIDQVARPGAAFARWRTCGAFGSAVPALAEVDDLTLGSVDCATAGRRGDATARRLAALTALFAPIGATAAEAALKRLRFANTEARWIGSVTDAWERTAAPMAVVLNDGTPTAAQLRRWASFAGRTRVRAVFRLASARWDAARSVGLEAPPRDRVASAYRALLRAAYGEPIELADLAVDGDDLRRSGVPAGPAMGRILHRLLDEVVEDPSRNRHDRLLERAATLLGDERRDVSDRYR